MNIISFVSTIVSFYTLILFVRVILTWVPSLEYSKLAEFLQVYATLIWII